MIVGIGWFAPSTIYSSEKISMALKMLVHIGVGITSLITVGFYLKWIPVQFGMGTIITTIILMIAVSAVIYAIFYFYYKNEARKINEKIKIVKRR